MNRVARFYTVGLLGVGVQLGTLTLLVHGLRADLLIATALAVETAVLHNFIWHERWTWRHDRPGRIARLCKFHLANGFISIVANVCVTEALVHAGVPVVAANAIAVAAASVANYLGSDRFVFRTTAEVRVEPTASRRRS